MSINNILVQLDQSERTANRLQFALLIARQHNARLVGLFAQRGQAKRVGVVSTWPPEEYTTARDASRDAFMTAAKGLEGAEWHDVNRGADDELIVHVANFARHFDMVILGQKDVRGDSCVPDDLVEDVLNSCGRPVLIFPYTGNFETVGKSPLIAWNNTREAARALNDSLPLIYGCDQAMVLSFATKLEQGQESCAAVSRHLQTHKVKTRTEIILVDNFGIMDLLLNRVSDQGADLLVMGAHGQNGLHIGNHGNGTRYILQHMTVPVLMSN